MSLIDLILNLAGLMIWVEWRMARRRSGLRVPAQMLVATLQRAEPGGRRRWLWPVALTALLVVRGFFYRQIGSEVNWTPSIPLGAIVLTFRSDLAARILLFSFCSFLASLGALYSCLLLLSSVNQKVSDASPQQRWIRAQLGRIDRWSPWLKLILPWVALTLVWLVFAPLISHFDIIPAPRSASDAVQTAMIIGLGGYFTWKYVIAGILFLYILNSYVYLGGAAFWTYINTSTQALTRPLSFLPLHLGKFDFSPIVLMGLVFLLSEGLERGLTALYTRIPFF